MRKRLVFRVDDVGYTPIYDLGVMKAFDSGIGSSADVMFDSPDTVGALKQLKERPWLSIGWHRHLWESPVLPPEEVPSLVDEEGRFKWRHRFTRRMAEATYEDAFKEFCAEAELCYSILGRYPDVAGTRQNDIPLERAFKDVLDKYNIVYDHFSHEQRDGSLRPSAEKYAYLNMISVNIQPEKGFGLELFKDYDPVRKMMNLTWTEKEEIYLYGWHPGYCDDHIMSESTCNIHRCKELQACTSEEFRNWIITNKVELINQRDAIYGTNEYQDHLKEINSPLWIGNM